MINVIGDIPEHLKPGADIEATIAFESLALEIATEAAGVIHKVSTLGSGN